jgi:hypothetical protein
MEQPELSIVNDAPSMVKEAFTSSDIVPHTSRVRKLLAKLQPVDASSQPIASPGSPHRWPRNGS